MKLLTLLVLSLSLLSCSSHKPYVAPEKQEKGQVPPEYKDKSDQIERHHLRELYTIM